MERKIVKALRFDGFQALIFKLSFNIKSEKLNAINVKSHSFKPFTNLKNIRTIVIKNDNRKNMGCQYLFSKKWKINLISNFLNE